MDYQIQKGDTLSKIVRDTYGVKGADVQKYYMEIAKINGIKDPNLIFAGTKLKLPEDIFAPKPTQDKPAEKAPDTEPKKCTAADKFNTWLDENTSAMDKIIQDYNSVLKKYDDNTIAHMNQSELADAQALLESTNQALMQQQDVINKSTFSIIDSDVALIREDGTTNKEVYTQEGAKFAQSLEENWESDGEEGIDFDEYRDAEIARLNGAELTQDGEELIEKAFDMMDLDDNGAIEQDEIQSVYSVIDMADGAADGKINFETYGNAIDTSDVIKEEAQKFRDNYLE